MLILFLQLISTPIFKIYMENPSSRISLFDPIDGTIEVFVNHKRYFNFSLRGDTLFLPNGVKNVLIQYRSHSFKESYFLHTLENNEENGKFNESFQSNRIDTTRENSLIDVDGTKRISISASPNGLHLDQGMYLSISGYAGGGVSLEGTIENNGTNEDYSRIEELDQAYLKLQGRSSVIQAGIFKTERYGTNVPIIGVSTGIKNKKGARIDLTYGEERGISNRMVFWGETGKQGPYVLLGANGESDIDIIDGTVKVYLDGTPMQEGRDADFRIDYPSHSIFFNPKRPILKGQKIEVTFQYRNNFWKRRIEKGIIGISNTFGNLNFGIFEERDLQNTLPHGVSPTLADSLAQWGDSAQNWSVPLVSYVGEKNGEYIKEQDHFKFVGKGSGDYMIRFMYVGEGRGSYDWIPSIGAYDFVGKGKGSYSPMGNVTPPHLSRLIHLSWNRESGPISSTLNMYLSQHDLNTLSPKDDGDNLGRAFNLNLKVPLPPLCKDGQIDIAASKREKSFFHPSLKWEKEFEEWFSEREVKEERGALSIKVSPLDGLLFKGKITMISHGMENLRNLRFSIYLPILRGLNYSQEDTRKWGPSAFGKREHALSLSHNLLGIKTLTSLRQEITDTSFLREVKEEIKGNWTTPVILSCLRRWGNKEQLDMATISISKSGRKLSLNLNGSIFLQPEGEHNEKRGIFSLKWRYKNSNNIGVWGEHNLNSASRSRKEERYVYVGLGKGDYRYDPERNIYLPEDGGDYKRVYTDIVEISPATLLENTIGFDYRKGENSASLSFLNRRKVDGIKLPLVSNSHNFYAENNITFNFYSLLGKGLYLDCKVLYLDILDGEYKDNYKVSEDRSFSLALCNRGLRFTKTLGFQYGRNQEGGLKEINWGSLKYGVFAEIKRNKESGTVSIKLEVNRQAVKDIIAQKKWIPFLVFAAEPSFRIFWGEYRIQGSLEGRYGITGETTKRSPLYPFGYRLTYNINATKPISETTHLSLEFREDRQEGYPDRKTFTLSLITNF